MRTLMLVLATVVAGVISEAARGNDQSIRVRGRIESPDEKPLAGARVTIPSTSTWDERMTRRPVASTTSGADGRFEISFDKAQVSPFATGGGASAVDEWKRALVVASADGFGMTWSRWDRVDAAGDLVLRLTVDDCPIEGRIVDPQHRPVTGANVTVHYLGPESEEELNAAYQRDVESIIDLQLWLPLQAAGLKDPVTDVDGRFRIAGLGRHHRVWMFLHGPTVGFAGINAVTSNAPPTTRMVDQPSGDTTQYPTQGAKFEFVATPAQSVEGTIRDAATKQPMSGVRVQSLRFAGPFQGFDPQGLLTSVTDAAGHYRLDGFPKGDGNQVIAIANDDQPYFMHEEEVPSAEGVRTIDLELHKGVWITGKVVNKTTGEPVPARIMYTTTLDNEHARDLPEFEVKDGYGRMHGYQSRYETKADGTYRVVALPGKAVVGAHCLDRVSSMHNTFRMGVGPEDNDLFKDDRWAEKLFQPAPIPELFNRVRVIEVPEGAGGATCDLELDPGETVHVTIFGRDGQPAKGSFRVRGIIAERYGGWYGKEVAGPTFDAVGFGPEDQRLIVVLDDARQLGAVTPASLASAPDHTLSAELQPMAVVSGRLLDEKGSKPVANVNLEAYAGVNRERGSASVTVREGKTDADGRFTIALPPGVRYYVGVSAGPYVGSVVAREIEPSAGGNVDLGDVRLEKMEL